MSLVLLLAGLILLLAGGSWFAGATTVGVICLVVGAVLFVVQLAWTAIVGNRIRKEFNKFDRDPFGLR